MHIGVKFTNDRERNIGWGDLPSPFLNILDPLRVVLKPICGDTDNLDTALLKVRCPTSHFRELSRAYRPKSTQSRF